MQEDINTQEESAAVLSSSLLLQNDCLIYSEGNLRVYIQREEFKFIGNQRTGILL
jgi:hypothetical protein